jgi:hypothetical protein
VVAAAHAVGRSRLQGAYTNKDENGIPMERPSQFQGKTIDQVQQSELADIIRQRQQQATEIAPASAAPKPAPAGALV